MSKNLHNIKGKEAIKIFVHFGGVERGGVGKYQNPKAENYNMHNYNCKITIPPDNLFLYE